MGISEGKLAKPVCLRWSPQLAIVTIRDTKDYIRVLLYIPIKS